MTDTDRLNKLYLTFNVRCVKSENEKKNIIQNTRKTTKR